MNPISQFLSTTWSRTKRAYSAFKGEDVADAITRLFRYAGFTAGSQQNQSLQAINHYKGWVYVAVRAIAEKVAQFKPTVARVKPLEPGEKSIHSKSWRDRTKSMTTLAEDVDLIPVGSSHPLQQLLNDPNTPDVTYSLWFKVMMYGELTGKVFWWLPYNNAGMPCEIWTLPPQWIRPDPGRNEDEPLIRGYWIRPMEGVAATSYIDAKDMIEWTQPSPVSIYDGYGPLQGGSAWIDTHESMDASRWHQMRNLHNPGLVLQLEKGMPLPDDAALRLAYAMLEQRLRGEGKNRMPLILPPGWQNAGRYGATNEELDFVASNDQIRDQVLALFRVPKGIVGIDPTANTSAYAPNAIFFDQCINPKLHYLGQVLTEKLAKRFGDDLVVYWQNAAPNDPVLEHQKANDALDRGAIVINEYREHLNKAPVEWGDTPLMRPGYVPMMPGGGAPLIGQDEIRNMLSQGMGTDAQPREDKSHPRRQGSKPTTTPAPLPAFFQRNRIKSVSIPSDAIKFTLPDVSQETSYSCGASAVSAICRAYGVGEADESWYREKLGSDDITGTDENRIRDLLDSLGLSTIVTTGTTDDQIKAWLDGHAPVLMLIQAWGDMPTDYGNPRSDNGHYVVAIGYTDEELIVEDPALSNTRGYLPWEELATRWHLPGLERWAMVVQKHEVMRYVRRTQVEFSKNGKH